MNKQDQKYGKMKGGDDCPLCQVSEDTISKLKKSKTGREKYLLRKEEKDKERLQSDKRKKNKKIIKIVVPVILVAGLVVLAFVFLGGGAGDAVGAAKIDISPSEYDAGNMPIGGGLVKHTYEIQNTGEDNLKISRIWTSCMCTTAKLRVGDRESDEFGMHDNPLFWSEEIAPGETGYLDVSFDPAFHGPGGTGNVVREVYLTTNDPQNKKAKAKLFVTVTP